MEQPVGLGPLAERANDLVRKHMPGPHRLQRIGLVVEGLIVGGNAGIAKDHAAKRTKNFLELQRFWRWFVTSGTP